MNAELKEQVRVAAYDANNVPAISPDERIRVYTSKEHVCHCIPITNRSLGLTVPILENGKIVEYWFEKGIRDIDLVLKHNSSIGDEYIFDDNIFKVVNPNQIEHKVYLKNPNIKLTEDSFIYSIYDEQTNKKDTFKIENINNLIYLDFIYTDNNVEENYFHFNKNQFKVYSSELIALQSTQEINITCDDETIIHSSDVLIEPTIRFTVNGASGFNYLINYYQHFVSIGNSTNTKRISLNFTNGVELCNLGTNYLRLYDNGNIDLAIGSENASNIITIKNNGSGGIQLYTDNNDVVSKMYISPTVQQGQIYTGGEINLQRNNEDIAANDEGLIQINDDGILFKVKAKDVQNENKNIKLYTSDHQFKINTHKFSIGKYVINDVIFESIPECIFPLLHDLNYTNNVSVQDGGYWRGNEGQVDLRNTQRFTSIFGNNNYFEIRSGTNSYGRYNVYEFSQSTAISGGEIVQKLTINEDGIYLSRSGGSNLGEFSIDTNTIKGFNLLNPDGSLLKVTPYGIQAYLNEPDFYYILDNNHLEFFTSTKEKVEITGLGITFTDNEGNVYFKNWYDLLS